jgi:2-oxoisovalerate dehydrogenase E2 component (dihydrolipoyl transacylase)
MNEFYLPDLGEGLQDAELVEWKVKKGDFVKIDQLMVIVETAKAIVEIPSPVNAQVVEILVAPGESVKVGAPMLRYEQATTDRKKTTVRKNSDAKNRDEPLVRDHHEALEEGIQSISVVGELKQADEQQSSDLYELSVDDLAVSGSPSRVSANRIQVAENYRFSPAIVAFAEKLGLEDYLSELDSEELSQSQLLAIYQQKGLPDKDLPIGERCDAIHKLSGPRKVMAQTMSKSHEQIPAVTLFDDADITSWTADDDFTLRMIKAVIDACRAVPLLNAWFDEEQMSVQTFADIHLGVAVNAKDGLFVPVLRCAQGLSSERIRDILNKQRQSIDARKIKPQKLLGATITLSNFGTLGGRYATPIIVPPQVAIVGFGKIRSEPLLKDGLIQPGTVAPISLSFDHRAATGAEAASFMQALIDSMQKHA